MKKFDILNQIKNNGLVAVIRGKDDEDAYLISKAILKGGINTLEVTFSTPYADNTIEKLSKEYKDDKKVLVGAGTVLDEVTARIAILKGAKFIVSPHFNFNIATLCNRYCIPYLPGCGSVTEVTNALESGCDVVKLFPGGILTKNFIKDIKGPLPHVNVMPSGGVSLENMEEWIKVGSYAIGIGSALVSKGYENIEEETKKFVDKYNSIKK